MPLDKTLLAGSTGMLLLKLLEEADLYGYQMIDLLAQRSDHTFDLKAGTLYPILHNLEKSGLVSSYEERAGNDRLRKYYHLTQQGRGQLAQKQQEWDRYSAAVNHVLKGGPACATP